MEQLDDAIAAFEANANTRRVATRLDCARRLFRLLADNDITQDELARACGVSTPSVVRWCDRNRIETPTVADLINMPRPIARGLIEWIAEAQLLEVDDAAIDFHEHAHESDEQHDAPLPFRPRPKKPINDTP